MDRKQLMLAALAPAEGSLHRPVQVQKLFFLIDRNIPQSVNGPHFNFQPYSYGPFDKAVYEELEAMQVEGYVDIVPDVTWRSYKLTSIGQQIGDELLATLPAEVQDYIKTISTVVRRLSFTQLVSAIYKEYPEMRRNSVFQG